MSAVGKALRLGEVVSFPDGTASTLSDALLIAAREVASRAFARADVTDQDGAYPGADVAALHEAGLLAAFLPREFGGAAFGALALCSALRQIGSGSLPLGRLFEGHVNALGLVLRYGDREQLALVAREVREGRLFGVWNTDDRQQRLRLLRDHAGYRLEGRKILASGAGHVQRPIVTASDDEDHRMMVMPRLRLGERADLSQWTAHGMRASATGSVDFSGLPIEPIEIVGDDGDYERQPAFSGGAWRFAAVHLGGLDRLFDLLRAHLRATDRGGDPHQADRLGQAAIAVEFREPLGRTRGCGCRSPVAAKRDRSNCRLRQSCSSCGRAGGSRSHGARSSVCRLAGVYPA